MPEDDPILQATPTGYDFLTLINLVVGFAILIAGALSIIYIFVGGISFILSGGDDGKIKKAVQTIRYAIIGLIITIFAVTIIAIVGNIFNFDLTSYIRWDRMSDIIRALVGRLGGTSVDSLPSDSL